MLEILGTKMVESKNLKTSLTRIYGLSVTRSSKLCKKLGYSNNFKSKNLNSEQSKLITDNLVKNNKFLNEELKKRISLSKKFLIKNKVYRGLRVANNLPARGQRTHTNAKTVRRVS